jgi:hypothetical protein
MRVRCVTLTPLRKRVHARFLINAEPRPRTDF